jgi:hypothetical protein
MTQSSHCPSRVTSRTIVFLFAALLAACGADLAADPEQSWDPANGEGPTVTLSPDEVRAGEESGAAGEEGQVEALVSCSYVQYCNAPGSDGTVCIYTNGCSRNASHTECWREINSICGGPTYPVVEYH